MHTANNHPLLSDVPYQHEKERRRGRQYTGLQGRTLTSQSFVAGRSNMRKRAGLGREGVLAK